MMIEFIFKKYPNQALKLIFFFIPKILNKMEHCNCYIITDGNTIQV